MAMTIVSYTIKCLITWPSRTTKFLKKDQGSNFSFCEQASLHRKPNWANEWERMTPSSQPLLTSRPLPQLQAEMTFGGFAPESHFMVMIVGPQKSMLRSVAQSCPTLCSPVDCSPPGSSVRGILQAGTLEWVAIPLSTFVSCLSSALRTCRNWIPYRVTLHWCSNW